MIQMAFTVLCLVATPWNIHFGSVKDVLRWTLTIPFLFTLMLASSMLALDYASMGAIIVVRNIAPLVTMIIERLFGEKIEVNVGVVLSLVYVIFGVALYTLHDVQFSATGMAYMLLNMLSAVFERLLQRKMIAVEPIDVSKARRPCPHAAHCLTASPRSTPHHHSSPALLTSTADQHCSTLLSLSPSRASQGGMMLLNNAASLVPMMGLAAYLGEHTRWSRLRDISSGDFTLLLVSCVNAVGISYAGINAQVGSGREGSC